MASGIVIDILRWDSQQNSFTYSTYFLFVLQKLVFIYYSHLIQKHCLSHIQIEINRQPMARQHVKVAKVVYVGCQLANTA